VTHPRIDGQITFLYTKNLEEMARFYEQCLGLSLKLDQGTCRIYQVSADGYLGFCRASGAAEQPQDASTRRVILTLVTPDVDEWYQYLREQGVDFEKPPTINDKFLIYHCFLRDPDGNLVEIQRFLHPF
jgi:catechol 2,3-dioxygenase-like lactoylglutathione lyase family enzyme